MKRHALVVVVVLWAVAVLGAQTPPAAEKELLELENDWATAVVKHDTAFLQKLYADEYLATDPEGKTFTKAQDIAGVKTSTYISFTLSDMKVHVYGDTAVVTGMNTVQGKEFSGLARFTDVFVRRDGRWQAVASQATKIAKK